MNVVASSTQEDWESIPLSATFAVLGGIALSAIALFAGMAVRWQTFQRRFVLPACACLLTAGLIGIAFSINETAKIERSPLPGTLVFFLFAVLGIQTQALALVQNNTFLFHT